MYVGGTIECYSTNGTGGLSMNIQNHWNILTTLGLSHICICQNILLLLRLLYMKDDNDSMNSGYVS